MTKTTKILLFLFVFIVLFVIAVFVRFCIKGDEPVALIAGVLGTCGLEFLVNGWLKNNKTDDENEKTIDLAKQKIKLLKENGIDFTVKDIFPDNNNNFGCYDESEDLSNG